MKNLGFAYWRSGHLSEALEYHSQALALDQEDDDCWGEAKTRNHLGFIHDRSGRFAEALEQQRRSLALYRKADDLCGQGRALIGVGNAYRQLGRHAASEAHLKNALTITREIGDRWGESLALIAIGFTYLSTGRHAESTRHLRQALTITRETGSVDIDDSDLLDDPCYAGRSLDRTFVHGEQALTCALRFHNRLQLSLAGESALPIREYHSKCGEAAPAELAAIDRPSTSGMTVIMPPGGLELR
jgi:tetratricopeptide (TPR) repeat protein